MAKINSRKQKSKSKLQIVFDEGMKFVSKSFIAFYLPSHLESFNSTIIASKKVGNAVKRNRCKRRLREIVRLYIKPNSPKIRLILIARAETSIVDQSLLMRDCNNLVKKISSA